MHIWRCRGQAAGIWRCEDKLEVRRQAVGTWRCRRQAGEASWRCRRQAGGAGGKLGKLEVREAS